MNLLDKKLGLLILAVLLFFSCEEELGELNVTPENNLGIFFAEIPLGNNTNQLWAGSVPGSFSGNLIAGTMQDSVLGNITAKAYGDISVERAIYDTATIRSAELISLTFNIRINGAVGSFEETDVQNFGLYKLSETINELAEINSASNISVDEKIGEAHFQIYRDSINLTTQTTDSSDDFDDNGFYIYQMPFELNEDYKSFFIESFVDAILKGVPQDDSDIDSVSYYLDENLKGIVIMAEDETNAIITTDVTDVENYDFDLVYRLEDIDGSTIERTANFLINSLKSFNNITPNEDTPWQGGVFNGVSEITSIFPSNTDDIHVHSGTNMLAAIDLSDFPLIGDTVSNLIINKATLSIKNVRSVSDDLPLTTLLYFTFSNSENIENGILSKIDNDLILTELPTDILYDTLDQSFNIEMPLFLQSLIIDDSGFDQIIIGSDLIRSDFNVGNDVNLSGVTFAKEDVSISFFYTITE